MRRLPLSVYVLTAIVFLSALAGCGGGGSASPTGDGGAPVAVEIPGLTDISALPYATGVVISGSSSISAPVKSTPWQFVAKTVGMSGNPFTAATSRNLCEATNIIRPTLGASVQSDQVQCWIKEDIAVQAAAQTPQVDVGDGSYHIASDSAGTNKIKFKITKDSNDIITRFEFFRCLSGTQVGYTLETISGTAATIAIRNIYPGDRSIVAVTGVLNPADSTQYTSKSTENDITGENSAGSFMIKNSLTQGAVRSVANSFDTRVISGGMQSSTRIYASFDFPYTGGTVSASNPFDASLYAIEIGTADLLYIDGDGNTAVNNLESWDINNLAVPCDPSEANCAAVLGQTPRATETFTVASFSGSEVWDCSGTADISLTFSTAANSCDRFTVDTDYITCPSSFPFTVVGTEGSTSLSTTEASPTPIASATPTLLLTFNQRVNTNTTNNLSNIIFTKLSDNSTINALDSSAWDSNYLVLTMTPTLASGATYRLTVVGGDSGVKDGNGDTFSSNQNFYIVVP